PYSIPPGLPRYRPHQQPQYAQDQRHVTGHHELAQGAADCIARTPRPMKIREEEPSEFPAIEALLQQAFGERMRRRLRRDALIEIALIVEYDQEIVGHIVLSWLPTKF